MNEKQKELNVFINESLDLLQEISDNLLALENNLDDITIINKLFRFLHTLKGGAALDGLDKISTVAHLMEDIFGIIRDENLETDIEYIDIFFDASDILRDLVEGIGENYDEIDVEEIKEKLREIKNELEPEKDNESLQTQPKEDKLYLTESEISVLEKSENKIFYILCKFDTSDAMKGINSYLIISNVKSKANFIKTNPSENDVKAQQFDNLEIIIETSSEQKNLENTIKLNCGNYEINLLQKEDLHKYKSSDEDEANIILTNDELNDLKKTEFKIYSIECDFDPTDEMKGVNSYLILNNLKPMVKFYKTNPVEEELRTKPFSQFKLLVETDSEQNKLENVVKANASKYSVNELQKSDLDKFTSKKKQIGIDQVIDNIIEKHSEKFKQAINSGEKVWKIILSFRAEDVMKGINSYVIFNNLKNHSSEISDILTPISPDDIKGKQDFTKFTIYLSGKISKDEIEKTIKMNCDTYEVKELSEEDVTIKKIEEPTKKQSAKDLQESASANSATADKKKEAPATKTQQPAYVEVDKDILDGVIENIGELVVNMNMVIQSYNELLDKDFDDIDMLLAENRMINAQLNASVMMCNSLMDYAVLLKLVPVKQVFKKFPRIVRDISKKLDKKVKLIIEGERTRIDQEILDAIEAPLLHMLRNSMDHGVENAEDRVKAGKEAIGIITLKAEQKKDRVLIHIIDNGKGMDKEKILKKAISVGLITEEEGNKLSDSEIFNFIYHPGFSTSEKVSQISGRGVGMDVVATEIHKVGGEIKIYSEKGKGTTMILDLPIAP